MATTTVHARVVTLLAAAALALGDGHPAAPPRLRPGPLPVFPQAEGFGTTTPAGRGGAVLRVTTLNDAGPGSLRAALEAAGPRVVVFDVAGTIRLRTNVAIASPYITVAGQTAPSPGITLRGATLVLRAHDVLVQHVRVRVGDEPAGPAPGNRDAISILGDSAYNVVIDHVSASWSIDEVLGTWYRLRDVTISHCILSEGLRRSLHPEGPHSDGVLVGEHGHNVALIGNLLAHNVDRNPAIKSDVSVIVVNNVVYNWGNGAAVHMWQSHEPTHLPTLASVVGNVFIPGRNTPARAYPIRLTSSLEPGSRVYVADNRWFKATADPWSVVGFKGTPPPDVKVAMAPVWIAELTVRPSPTVEAWVLATAGARPTDRDAVDARVVAEVRARTGRIIDSQRDVGGWPEAPARARALTLPARPNADDDGDGYTNLEQRLHQLAAELEGRSTP